LADNKLTDQGLASRSLASGVNVRQAWKPAAKAWSVRGAVAASVLTASVLTASAWADNRDGATGAGTVAAAGEAPDEAVLAAQQARQSAMARAADATIAVFGLDGGGGGSGVIITPDGYALTNFHVTSACGDHMRCGLNDGSVVDAVIVGIDATGDVSLIKLLGRDDFPTAPLADSDTVRAGQWCFAAGNPFGLATNLQPSVSLGLVSGTGRYQYPAGTLLEYADCIQTDAAINPGNSGGPLFNLDGEVIGINGRCSFEKRGRVNVGVGYAISINQIKSFLGMLRSGRLVDHATLGATVATDEAGKVLVSNILNSSDAYRRGLRFGDEILRFAGREIRSTNDFKNVLGTLPKDWRVPLTVRRDGKTETLLVRLAGVHSEAQLARLVAGQSQREEPPPQRPGEKPRPGDKPQRPGEEKEGQPKEGGEGAVPRAEQADEEDPYATHPARPNFKLVKQMLEPREGFANYYFNRLERQQVWQRVSELGDFASLPAAWKLTGTVAGETTAAEVWIGPAAGQLRVGSRSLDVPLGDELAELADRNDDRGLLVALRAWQELLVGGPTRLGDTLYLGTAPIYPQLDKNFAQVEICDCLQTTWYDAIVRFYVPVGSSEVALIEVTGGGTRDPVEVYLDRYREQAGKRLPGRLRLQYGTEPRLLLSLEHVAFEAPEAAATSEN
jgi:serine protease Do